MAMQPTDLGTFTATESEDTTAAEAIAEIAAEAEADEAKAQQAEADAEAAQEGEWEDADAQEEQARALAALGVQGVEFMAGIINPGHSLDQNTRAQGVANLLPVARDLSGEIPEWLRPYMHYLSAGLWVGGVMIGAVKARREIEAEAARQEAERKKREQAGAGEGAAYGV